MNIHNYYKLKPKDKIVIAGVNALKDGDLVRPLNADGVSK